MRYQSGTDLEKNKNKLGFSTHCYQTNFNFFSALAAIFTVTYRFFSHCLIS